MSRLEVHDVVVERVRALRAEGYRTGLVTNNVKEASAQWRVLVPVDELFEVVVDSSEVGMRKPNPGHLPARARAARRRPARARGLPRRRPRQRRRRSSGRPARHPRGRGGPGGGPGRARTRCSSVLDRGVKFAGVCFDVTTPIRGIDGRFEEGAGALRAVGPPGAARLVLRRGVGSPRRQLQVDRDEAVRGARRLGRHRPRARRQDAPRHPLLPPRVARRAVAQAAARAAGDEPGPAHPARRTTSSWRSSTP